MVRTTKKNNTNFHNIGFSEQLHAIEIKDAFLFNTEDIYKNFILYLYMLSTYKIDRTSH